MKQFINKVILISLVLSGLFLFGCNKSNNVYPNSNDLNKQEITFEKLVHNKGSMTKVLLKLHQKFSITLLKDGVLEKNYVRISSLQLDHTPVITALVSTSLSDKTFVHILKHAATTSIGKALFAKGANIHRSNNMKIKTITVNDINNPIIHKYLNKLGYKNSAIIVMRKSQFIHEDEVLNIIEYILPSMHKFVPIEK